MFTTEKIFEVLINSGGEKSADVRYPTDEELCEWKRKQRVVHRPLNNGYAQSEIVNWMDVHADLFRKCFVGSADEFDDAERCRFMEKVLRCDVQDARRNGEGYVIDLKLYGGQRVSHHLRMPTQKQNMERQRSSTRIIRGRHNTEIRDSMDAAGPLWDKLQISTEGYIDRVPILHKEAALQEVFFLMEKEGDDPDPEL